MKLAEMTVTQFVDSLASDAPAPGGGSAAALMGALGAGLTAMVGCLTQGRKKYAEYADFAARAEGRGNELKAKLLDVMERDTEAFNLVSAAFALPRETDEEKAKRSAAIHGTPCLRQRSFFSILSYAGIIRDRMLFPFLLHTFQHMYWRVQQSSDCCPQDQTQYQKLFLRFFLHCRVW